MSQLSRRDALKFSVFSCATLLAGCGGSDDTNSQPLAPSPAPAPTSASAWNVVLPTFTGTSTFDLSTTLPNGIVKGGAFGVSTSGPALPTGVTLSRAGVLAVASAAAGRTIGVVFTYTEPSG